MLANVSPMDYIVRPKPHNMCNANALCVLLSILAQKTIKLRRDGRFFTLNMYSYYDYN